MGKIIAMDSRTHDKDIPMGDPKSRLCSECGARKATVVVVIPIDITTIGVAQGKESMEFDTHAEKSFFCDSCLVKFKKVLERN